MTIKNCKGNCVLEVIKHRQWTLTVPEIPVRGSFIFYDNRTADTIMSLPGHEMNSNDEGDCLTDFGESDDGMDYIF